MPAPDWIRYHLDGLKDEAEGLIEQAQMVLKRIQFVEEVICHELKRETDHREYERKRKAGLTTRVKAPLVRPKMRFVADDKAGLWKAGEVATDLGWESDHPAAPPMRMLELEDKRVVILHDPIKRGLIEPV